MEQTILKAQVPRTALMKQLDSLLKRRFIYIHAPAGFGKTTAALLWLEHLEILGKVKRAWVSLDKYDNKTSEFCKRFVSALTTLQPENTALKKLADNQGFYTAPVEFTLQALGAFFEEQNKFILVLDDLHNINNDEILKLIPILNKRLRGEGTILCLSRTSPPDSFSEMMAKEELAVVDAEYLQFTGGEIKVFFDKNGRFLTSKQAEKILASTGGWAIGIRALLMSEEKSYNIDLNNRYLENFLKAHVWERWDDHLKRFMMLVSVTEGLTPELCDCLIADEKNLKKTPSAEMLTSLARENAFLRETEKNTYRFHDLFREFLLHRLEENSTQIVSRQFIRVGDYFYNKKEYFRAIDYYIKGKNNGGVAKSFFCMYDYNSYHATMEETLAIIRSSIDDSITEKYPSLSEVRAWAAFLEGRAEDFEKYLDEYRKHFAKILLQNPKSVLTKVLLNILDYRNSCIEMTKKIRNIPFMGSIKVTTPSITQNMPFFHRSFRDFSEYAFDTDYNLALLEKTAGVVVGAEFDSMKNCILAGLYYEKGNLNKAEEYSVMACSCLPKSCHAEIIFCSCMILCMTFLANNQNKKADEVIENIKAIIHNDSAFYLNDNFNAFLFRLKLSDGDNAAANEWLNNCNQSELLLENLMFYKMYQYFTTARAYIVNGDYSNANLLLQKMLKLNEKYRRPLDIIETRILLAILNWKKRGHGQTIALDYLEQAVVTAHEYGYTQVFANEGAELVNMLSRMQKRTVQSNYSGEKLPFGFVKTLHIAAITESKRSKGLTGGRSPEDLIFTDKQLTVMRLMCEGLNRTEIAEKMGLKPNGVKSHTTLIYKKLDVYSNIEAIMKIKELGLLNEKGKE
ncbi:MAG: LuxR C-terminal-related transcriptional regulator [Oscillospiraceae bacterium]|nr:LuxR C-terminal-related transcriptional regulator [Oscillospiraceae bacterium]